MMVEGNVTQPGGAGGAGGPSGSGGGDGGEAATAKISTSQIVSALRVVDREILTCADDIGRV